MSLRSYIRQIIEEQLKLNISFKKGYIGQCDGIRRKYEDGEEFWQHVMSHHKKISEAEFTKKVDAHEIRDEDESWEDYRDYVFSDNPDAYFAKSEYQGNMIYFLATGGTNGFEWFWVV